MRTNQEQSGNMSSLKWIVFFLLLPSCWTHLLCPDGIELGSPLLLICHHSGSEAIFINSPYGTNVACFLSRTRCETQDGRLNNTIVNTTHVILDVNPVQDIDGGNWSCGPAGQLSHCQLTVFQVPSCEISSETDPDKLHIGEEIRLSVTIEDHFCSKLTDFQLQTGFATEKLVDDFHADVANSTDVFNSTFNISDSHIGSVELLFSCNTTRRKISCGSVKSLRLQSCNISLREHTDDRYIYAGVDQEVSLEVHVEKYSCPGNLSYLLLAGDVREDLERRNDTGQNIYESTFNITKPHFGPVSLQLMCNDVNRNVSCGGVQRLVKTNMKHEIEAIVAWTVATLFIIFIIIAVITRFLITRYRKCSKTSALFNESCPNADVADNSPPGPKSMRHDNGACAEIADINGSFGNTAKRDIVMVPNPVYEGWSVV